MSANKSAGGSGFTAEEQAAMRERAKETRRASSTTDDEAGVLAKIAEMSDEDRAIAEKIHEIVTANVPDLSPKTWYGMPGYAKDGKVMFFFQAASKFKSRYATLGFNDSAALDEGGMWPVAFAIEKMTPKEEARITALVKKAAG